MNNKTIELAQEIGEQQTGSYYLQLFLYRAPEKNNEAIAKKNLKQFAGVLLEQRLPYLAIGVCECL
jgi:hypothetical protein